MSAAKASASLATSPQDRPAAPPSALAERFLSVRAATEMLAAPLSAEDQTVQSMPDASPTKWHRAHTSWFFETFVLAPHQSGYRSFDPHFSYLFNSYYEAVGARHQRCARGMITRPGIAEIAAYRAHVDAAMMTALCDPSPEIASLVELGIHHEQQHQELLLTDIKHAFAANPLGPAYAPPPLADAAATAPKLEWIDVAGGRHAIGHQGEGFAFDNEGPAHEVLLRDFRIASRPVSVGDYLDFIEDGGYRRASLWLSDGWATRQCGGLASAGLLGLSRRRSGRPIRFMAVCRCDRPNRSAMSAFMRPRPMPPGPTNACRPSSNGKSPRAASATEASLRRRPGRIRARSRRAFIKMSGNGPAAPISPIRAYRPAAGAVGEYNGKFMINQMVLRGRSCATPPGHDRLTYRNFFPPAARWQFSGFRLAQDV